MAIKNKYPEEFDKYFKFCFVRNPWDRLSSFFHAKKHGFLDVGGRKPAGAGIVKGYVDLNDFVLNFNWGVVDKKFNHLTPQIKWITDEDGRIMVDHVSSYENFNVEVRYLCSKMGLVVEDIPRNRKSTNSKFNYRELYADESKNVVERVYREDIEKFGYNF
jgi:hypothetical protein